MNLRGLGRIRTELSAVIEARTGGFGSWNGTTTEVGREEVWVRCEPSEFTVLRPLDEPFRVTIELPPNGAVAKRCMKCDTRLLGIDELEDGSARFRFRVVHMSICDCKQALKANGAGKRLT